MTSAFEAALAERVLLCDGAMGTLAQATGGRADGPGAELCVIAPELVTALHRRYLDAGADVLQTHSFGASRLRLERHGLARRTREINLAAARLARGVADGAGRARPVFVAGSLSPATPSRGLDADAADVRAAVREQAAALAEGGVDLVLLETFTHARELVDAVGAVREATDLPVVAQATFVVEDGTPLSVHGETPAEVAARLADLGLAAIGTNCTLGPQGLLAVVRRMAGASVPLVAQPNAGLPHVVSDRGVRFAADAAHFGRYVVHYVAAGARLVGGCCGTTPEHVAAAAAVLAELPPASPPGEDGPDSAAPPPAPSAPLVVRPRAAWPAGEPSPVGRGALARWLDAAPGARPFLVAAEVPVTASDDLDHAVARGRTAVDAGAPLLWVGRERSRRRSSGAPGMSAAAVAVACHDRVEADTALTVTSWNASPMALQADLLGLDALGIRTLVCETGNPPVLADRAVREGVWEVDAVALVALAASLNAGVDADGVDLAAPTAFRIGVRLNPAADDLDREVRRVVRKVAAGAEFLVTRPVHSATALREAVSALAAAGVRVPLLLSVAPLSGFAEAEQLRHEVPDTDVPDTALDRLRAVAADPVRAARVGVELAEEVLTASAGLVDGLVVRTPGPDAPGPDGPGSDPGATEVLAAALDRWRAAAGVRPGVRR